MIVRDKLIKNYRFWQSWQETWEISSQIEDKNIPWSDQADLGFAPKP